MSRNIFTILNTVEIFFYLVFNDLKGCFKYSKEKNTTEPSSSEHNCLEHKKELEFIIEDQKQAKIYNQIWNKVKRTY